MPLDLSELIDLDPDDPRAPSQQIANALRAAILVGRLAPGAKLPSQHELTRRYGVARETVKSALRILDREHLVVSRQGSGSFVRTQPAPPTDLRTFLRSAYDRPEVTIDYAGWRGETLSHTLPDSFDVILDGRAVVRSLNVRLLLTDPRIETGLPRPIRPTRQQAELRRSLLALANTAITTIRAAVTELRTRGVVETVNLEVRVHPLGPTLKIYTLNRHRSLIGFYPITEYSMRVRSRDIPLHHPSGWDSAVFEDHVTEPDPPFARQAQGWFESIWSTIAVDYQES